ncbi:MAG: hypothetical protein QG574_3531 [Cyanobacteriota bacterium erpe_2018_sw_21hr_WHONDRS-SW48-000092_B_bin.40]|nr:hypothetical protein [Cyanobacteriota bacterium erpe_2018_sw_21hr_WHONDRS-SW48-000092_B_bin.40]
MLSFPAMSFKRKRAIKNKIQSYFISSPCSVKWDDMQADQSNISVRFCGDCKLNVHNLSRLSDEEVVVLLDKKAAGERVCTYFYRKDDGTLVTDNCPKQMKQMRDRLQAYAASMMVALCWQLASSADAQGLVSQPVDPRYTQVGHLGDMGYDCARDLSRMATALSFVLACLVGWLRRNKVKRDRLAIELFALALIPILVHLIGTSMINNMGGLGGGI